MASPVPGLQDKRKTHTILSFRKVGYGLRKLHIFRVRQTVKWVILVRARLSAWEISIASD